MNFKRNLLNIIALMGSVVLVSGCKNPKSFQRFEFLDPIKDLKQVEDTHTDEDYGSYIKYGDYSDYIGLNSDKSSVNLGSTYNVLRNYANQHVIPSIGDRKILVIPVEFDDFTISDLGVNKEDYVNDLEKAFFGVSSNNKYISVSEYYNRSSYGKLRLSGKVCDRFYRFPLTTETLIKEDKTSNDVFKCYSDVVNTWFPYNYPDEDLNQYRVDPNNPNSDVAIYLVYTYPTELKQNTKVFWDYTFLEKPFSWSSYSCLNTIQGAPDSHTLIHETGHLLGLTDYYPKNENDPDPTGRIDMMDCSVGDHSAFSKMVLNWARPYYVKDSCEINIRSLSNYGDLILINDLWDGSNVNNKAKRTVFDEYYLIELYTPIGINYFDASVGNNKAKLPLLPGIKIYHVDARLGIFHTESAELKTFVRYCDGEASEETKEKDANPALGNVTLAHNNNAGTETTTQPQYNLYELKLNNEKYISDSCAKDNHLFHKGDSFVIDSSSFNVANNPTKYTITVSSLNFREASIKITKN